MSASKRPGIRPARLLSLMIAIGILAVTVVGCDSFLLDALLNGETGTPLQIDPEVATVPAGETVTFTAAGGVPPYSFAVPTGNGSIDAATGLYIAPLETGSATISVTDLVGTVQTALVVITDPSVNSVDYQVDSVTWQSGAYAGRTMTGSFVVSNLGADDGTHDIGWQVYASPDTNLDLGSDSLVSQGTHTPIDAGVTADPIAFSGDWPAVATTYHLIVLLLASPDDSLVENNELSDAGTVVTIAPPTDVDYIVVSLSEPVAPVTTGSALDEELHIRNNNSENGSATVFWEVRVSVGDAVFDGTDIPLQSGNMPALASDTTSDPIPLSGLWPADGGDYYLVARVTAADDINNSNNDGASGLVEVYSPTVDYVVSSVTTSFPSATTNSSISENFVYKNSGGISGTLEVSYTAYLHTLPDWDAGDTIIGSESLGVGSWLDAGVSSAAIPISAFWPATADIYYLTIEVSATDNSNTSNDRLTVGPFSVSDPPDYEVTIPAFPVAAYGGHTTEMISTASTDHGGSPLHQVQITEIDSNDGLADLTWRVYQSDDTILDGLDVPVASNTIPALSADGNVVVDVDFPLPGTWGEWYYLVNVTAGDDSNPTNNTSVVGPILVWSIGGNAEFDTAEDDSNPASRDDFSVLLNPGDNVFFNGLIDENGKRDSFVFSAGPNTTEFQIRATWASGSDNLNLSLFTKVGGLLGESNDAVGSMEPSGGGYWTVSGITPSQSYFLEAMSLETGDVGQSYTIEVIGGP